MKTRLCCALTLVLALAAVPAHALPLGPLNLPGSWLVSLMGWLTGSGAEVNPDGLMAVSQATKVCRDASGAVIPCQPTSSTDGGGCLDPHGRPTPCNPGP
jgi:hypothetical protein